MSKNKIKWSTIMLQTNNFKIRTISYNLVNGYIYG